MSDYGSLRPPPSPSTGMHHGINRSSSPVGNQAGMQSQRYSLGKPSAGGPTKSPSMQNTSMHSMQGSSAAAAAVRQSAPGFASVGLRPRSEMAGSHGQGLGHSGSAESDAIDQWFEDLQHYEATLEEMAAASLDQNFKEELSAIEQWFRVLSEAERTAALYSLLQESTQVQIRFFITVLQQMARSDPMSALLSPSHHNSTMAEQMEAKLASLGLKSPSAMKSPASPASRGYRQSSDAAGFLSPNTAAMYGSGLSGDAAAMLAAQRAKLKSNRISAPGTLPGDLTGQPSRNFSGGLDQVQEGRSSHSPGPEGSSRPKSTDGLSAASRSPRSSGPLDDQLSPITSGGNWASMVNTPLVNMFDDGKGQNGQNQANVNMDLAAAQLAGLGPDGRVVIDPDAAKYRRKSNQGPQQQGQGQGQAGVQGVLSGMYQGEQQGLSPNMPGSPGPWATSQADLLRQAMASVASPNANFNAMAAAQMSPNALAGLQSPSGGLSNPVNMQMMNAMAAMGGLGNMSAAQFLAMQQQILANQQQIAAMAAGGSAANYRGGAGAFGAPIGRQAGVFGGLGAGGLAGLAAGQMQSGGRRSPSGRPSAGGRTAGASGAGGGSGEGAAQEEVAPLSVLEDVPAWLRYLRLHKYTPNFETSNWREMVQMDDKELEARGVAALGARRKMLKTFELVREKYGIKGPEGSAAPAEGAAKSDEAGKEESEPSSDAKA